MADLQQGKELTTTNRVSQRAPVTGRSSAISFTSRVQQHNNTVHLSESAPVCQVSDRIAHRVQAPWGEPRLPGQEHYDSDRSECSSNASSIQRRMHEVVINGRGRRRPRSFDQSHTLGCLRANGVGCVQSAIRSTTKNVDYRQQDHSPEHSPQSATKAHCRSDRSMTAVDLPIDTNPLKSLVAFMWGESEWRKICMLPWLYSWEPQPLSSLVRRGGTKPAVTIENQRWQVGWWRHICPITGWA